MVEILSSPVKSESDKKEYRVVKLSNGLKALLIKQFVGDNPSIDNKTGAEVQEGKNAAVSLCVGVGSFRDPKDIQGMNHFMEHMIFMGSAKYPKENEYHQYMRANGGSANAYTSFERTVFFFDIVQDKLEGAIDRFSNLFISPLMLKDSMEREMEAVESEFQNNISDDTIRANEFCASLANGPVNLFGWGNLKTLKDGTDIDKLNATVHAFRRKHYIANRMHVCVESTLSLDEMQKLVEDNFTAIQSGPEPEPLTIPQEPFKAEFFDKVYYLKPVADKSELHLSFLLPSMEKHYKSNPSEYLRYIFQHEGVGSLTSYLKKRLLAENVKLDLDENDFKDNSFYLLFTVIVTLTENGLSDVDAVLDAIFSFLLMLKTTSVADHEKAYSELKQIRDTTFKYLKEKEPIKNVEELCANMALFETADILSGKKIFSKFNGKLIQQLINQMNVRKFNISLFTNKHDKYEKTEKWFGIEYDEVGECSS